MAAAFGPLLRACRSRRTGPNAAVIAQKAQEAQQPKFGEQAPGTPDGPLAASLTVYPKGRTLPPSFLAQRWEDSRNEFAVGRCVALSHACDALLADMDGDGAEEVLLADDESLWVYKAGADGRWAPAGSLEPMGKDVRKQLETGAFVPSPSQWKSLDIGGQRLQFIPDRTGPAWAG